MNKKLKDIIIISAIVISFLIAAGFFAYAIKLKYFG